MGQEICDGSGAPGAHCRPAVVIEGEKRQDTHYFTSQILVFVNNHSDFWEKKNTLFCSVFLTTTGKDGKLTLVVDMIFCDGKTTERQIGRSF